MRKNPDKKKNFSKETVLAVSMATVRVAQKTACACASVSVIVSMCVCVCVCALFDVASTVGVSVPRSHFVLCSGLSRRPTACLISTGVIFGGHGQD